MTRRVTVTEADMKRAIRVADKIGKVAIPEGLKQSCGIMALRRKPATRAPFDPKRIFRGAVNPAPATARVFRAAQEMRS